MKTPKAFKTKINELFKTISFTVQAEEEPQGDEQIKETPQVEETSTPQQTVNFEDLIANARKQEKDKLYPQIKKLEEEKKKLVEKNNQHLLTIGEKDARIKELELLTNSDSVSEKETALQNEIESLKTTIANMEKDAISVEEIESSIRAEYEVKLYREQKLREIGDTVIPELIVGTTKEEIDASIVASQERFNQISNKILGSVQVPVANVSTSSFQSKDLKLEDIANLDPRGPGSAQLADLGNLDPRSPEYAQLRAKLGLR